MMMFLCRMNSVLKLFYNTKFLSAKRFKKGLVMKKYMIAVLIFLSINLFGKDSNENVLLLVNPTVGSLRTFHQMVEKDVLNIPNLKILGIHDLNHHYDFSKSDEYIQKEAINYIEIKGFDLTLSLDSLFVPNKKTKLFKKLFMESKGILFTGGPDIPPPVYGEETSLLTGYIPEGRLYELSFLFHLLGGSQNENFKPLLELKKDYIVLGICLGMQMMNVATGGTLVQDIPTEIYHVHTYEGMLNLSKEQQHKNYKYAISYGEGLSYFNIHHIELKSNSIFNEMELTQLNNQYQIISSHHQCIEKLGMHIEIAALSLDKKIIEAVQHKKYKNVYGVQFHPEYWGIYNSEYQFKSTPNDKSHAIENEFDENSMKFHHAFWKYFCQRF